MWLTNARSELRECERFSCRKDPGEARLSEAEVRTHAVNELEGSHVWAHLRKPRRSDSRY